MMFLKDGIFRNPWIPRICLLFICLSCIFMIPGCKSGELEQDMGKMLEQANEEEPEPLNLNDMNEKLHEMVYTTCVEFRDTWCTRIIIASMAAGGLLLLTVKRNKRIRQFALFTCIIGIPIACIVVLFGAGFVLPYLK